MNDSKHNPRTRVKICGLKTLEDARFASGAMADFLGFIFYPKSARYIDPDQASAIMAWIEGPQTVGVFVDQPLDDVIELAGKTGINMIQLHGNESPEYCELLSLPIIKAIPVNAQDTVSSLQDKIAPYVSKVDYLLFDTQKGEQSGGTGIPFDWALLRDVQVDIPYFVAGGIGTHNAMELIDTLQPFAMDVNSTLEVEPGIKDLDLMVQFFDRMNEIWLTQDDE